MPTPSENFLKEAFKDKIMIWIFRIIGLTISFIIIVIAVKIALGRYTNIWGLEINKSEKNMDTVFVKDRENVTHTGFPAKQLKVMETGSKIRTNVIGDKNHTITGNNNQVGVNGDVNINPEKTLTESDEVLIDEWILKVKREKNINSNCLTVLQETGTSTSKFVSQLVRYLKSKGYNVTSGFSQSSDPTDKGIFFTPKDTCIDIRVSL